MTRAEARQAIYNGNGIERETKNFVYFAGMRTEKVSGFTRLVYYLSDTAKDTQYTNTYYYDDVDGLLYAISETAPISQWKAAQQQEAA